MTNDDNPAGWPAFHKRTDVQIALRGGTALLLLSLLAVQPVVLHRTAVRRSAKQIWRSPFRDLFTIINSGAIIGGLIALRSGVATLMIRRADS